MNEPQVLLATFCVRDEDNRNHVIHYTIPRWYSDLIELLFEDYEEKETDGSCHVTPGQILGMMDDLDRGDRTPLD